MVVKKHLITFKHIFRQSQHEIKLGRRRGGAFSHESESIAAAQQHVLPSFAPEGNQGQESDAIVMK